MMAVLAIGVTGWTWIIVGITFLIYIGVAVWARAGSTKEFYVAGEGVPPLLNGMATAADWMSAASFISMAGLIAFMGYQGSSRLSVFNGLDWWIRIVSSFVGSVFTEVWKVYRT